MNRSARALVACVAAFLLSTLVVPASAGDLGPSVGNDDWAVCGTWREVPVRDGREHVTDVEVVSPYEAWVVAIEQHVIESEGHVYHWGGMRWTEVPFPKPSESWTLDDIVVVSPSEAWIVGSKDLSPHHRPLVARWDGVRWRLVPLGLWKVQGFLFAVVEDPRTGHVIAVGTQVTRGPNGGARYRTLILRWNGTAWHRMPSPTPGVGSGYGDVVAAGSQLWAVGWTKPRGEMYRFLASRLSPTGWTVRLGPHGDWREVDADGVSAHQIWAVGSAGGARHEGLVARWNGHGWRMDRRLVRVDRLTGVVAPSRGDVWAVGYTYGQEPRILHRTGGVWRVDWARHTWGNLHAIGGTPHNLWTFLSYPVEGGNDDDPALAFTSLHRC